MKKYLLNKYNLILIRMTLTKKLWPNEKSLPFYMVEGYPPCIDIKYGEKFYAFDKWRRNKYKNSNVFSEKDYLLKDSIIKQTNNWFRYIIWKIKYHHKNRRIL